MDIIDKIIETEEVFTVDESSYDQQLTEDEIKGIKDLLKKFNKKNCINIFRGVDQNLIEEMLGTDDLNKGIQLFFRVGEKSAYFHKNMIDHEFNKLEELLINIKEGVFNKYISIDIEIDDWVERIYQYTDGSLYKLKLIYLYYCIFFHIEDTPIKDHNSMLISTTLKYDIAKKFSRGYTNDVNGVVLHIIKPYQKLSQTTNRNSNLVQDLIGFKIPHIKGFNPLPHESEINFMLGIYPQCIFAIEKTKENKLYINPHLLDCLKDSNKERYLLEQQEILIDQTQFIDWIKTTKYKRYATPETLDFFNF